LVPGQAATAEADLFRESSVGGQVPGANGDAAYGGPLRGERLVEGDRDGTEVAGVAGGGGQGAGALGT
jgi:hypothetical protein